MAQRQDISSLVRIAEEIARDVSKLAKMSQPGQGFGGMGAGAGGIGGVGGPAQLLRPGRMPGLGGAGLGMLGGALTSIGGKAAEHVKDSLFRGVSTAYNSYLTPGADTKTSFDAGILDFVNALSSPFNKTRGQVADTFGEMRQRQAGLFGNSARAGADPAALRDAIRFTQPLFFIEGIRGKRFENMLANETRRFRTETRVNLPSGEKGALETFEASGKLTDPNTPLAEYEMIIRQIEKMSRQSNRNGR